MRGFLVAVALVPLLGGASDGTRPNQTIDPCAKRVTAKQFERFAKAVWRLPAWERGKPPRKVIRAQRHKLGCAAGPGHRRAMKKRWRGAQAAYFEHRRAMLWRVRVTPFPGGGQFWAVPYSIVVCESGARGYVPSGYYGILFTAEVPTWQTWGEPHFAPTPGQASKREQDIVAHRLYRAYGLEPWECAGMVGLR